MNQTQLASFNFGAAALHLAHSQNVTCMQRNRFRLLSGSLKHHSRKVCRFAKRDLCAARSFPTVGTAFSGRQTCVGVRSGDRAFLLTSSLFGVVAKSINKRKLKRRLGPRRTPSVRGRNVW